MELTFSSSFKIRIRVKEKVLEFVLNELYMKENLRILAVGFLSEPIYQSFFSIPKLYETFFTPSEVLPYINSKNKVVSGKEVYEGPGSKKMHDKLKEEVGEEFIVVDYYSLEEGFVKLRRGEKLFKVRDVLFNTSSWKVEKVKISNFLFLSKWERVDKVYIENDEIVFE